jgi:hypothetical protein
MAAAAFRSTNFTLPWFSCLMLAVGCGGGGASTPASQTQAAQPVSSQSATAQIAVAPNPLNFGQVALGTTTTQDITITNLGTADVAILSASLDGLGYRLNALSIPFTVFAGHSLNVPITFAPSSSGTVTGSVSFVRADTNTAVTVAVSRQAVSVVSGGATVAPAHQAVVSWTASTSVVGGDNVYRGGQTGGPYTKVNASLVSGFSYSDSAVTGGQTYFNVVTAVAETLESGYSAEAMAVIPSP